MRVLNPIDSQSNKSVFLFNLTALSKDFANVKSVQRRYDHKFISGTIVIFTTY